MHWMKYELNLHRSNDNITRVPLANVHNFETLRIEKEMGWTTDRPRSSCSCLEIHFCWDVDSENRCRRSTCARLSRKDNDSCWKHNILDNNPEVDVESQVYVWMSKTDFTARIATLHSLTLQRFCISFASPQFCGYKGFSEMKPTFLLYMKG